MRYAQIIETEVVNVIIWDGKTEFDLDGELIETETANVGWSYVDETFLPPPEELPA